MHRYVEGGMVQMSVTIAVAPPDAQSQDGYVQVQPMLTQSCGSSTAKSNLSSQAGTTFGNWSIYDIVYTLGPVSQLACELPPFAKLEFNMPSQYDIRIAAIRISGVGSPAPGKLQQIPTALATPKAKEGILSNMLFVWIAAGIGSLIVFFLLLLVWYCCGRPMCCCGSRRKVRALRARASAWSITPFRKSVLPDSAALEPALHALPACLRPPNHIPGGAPRVLRFQAGVVANG